MGFWDTLGKVAKGVGEQYTKRINDMEEYKEKYESYSDEQLFSRLTKTASAENMAILSILKNRGYDGKMVAERKGWDS